MREALAGLVDEIRLTFHALESLAADLHGEHIEPPGRAVIELVANKGPTTVPRIAEARGVSRQHIQTIVNTLSARELVTTEPNPSHRRSPLIALTTSGAVMARAIADREADFARTHLAALETTDLLHAASTVGALREAVLPGMETP